MSIECKLKKDASHILIVDGYQNKLSDRLTKSVAISFQPILGYSKIFTY